MFLSFCLLHIASIPPSCKLLREVESPVLILKQKQNYFANILKQTCGVFVVTSGPFVMESRKQLDRLSFNTPK